MKVAWSHWEPDWAEFNAATSTIDALRPSVRSPAASPRHSPLASRRAPAPVPHENAYGELRAPPLPPRKSLSPAEPAILAASSVQDITAHTIQAEPRRRSSLEPEPDSRHRLTSFITGSTETITGIIDTRHEVPPDPRAFEKPRRACTPQSGSRPLPAPPPERYPSDDRPTPTEPRPDRTDRQPPTLPDNRIPDRTDRHIPDKPTDKHTPESRHERHLAYPPENRTDRLLPNLECRQERLAPSISDSRLVAPDRIERPPERHILLPENRINLERPLHNPNAERHIGERDRSVPSERHSVELRQPPERPPDKPDRVDRSSFDRDRVENRAPPRQRSLPSTTSGSVDHHPTKSITMPKFPSEDAKDPPYENVGVEINELAVGPKKFNPLTHDKNGRKYGDNVSYENINLDYIARLVGEGYPKDIVVRALGITRNDLEMACDILHEFGSKVPNKC